MARDINGHIIYGPPPKSDEEWRKEGEKFARAMGLEVKNDSSTNSAMLEIALAVRDLCDVTVLDNWAKLAAIKERVNAVVSQLQQ